MTEEDVDDRLDELVAPFVVKLVLPPSDAEAREIGDDDDDDDDDGEVDEVRIALDFEVSVMFNDIIPTPVVMGTEVDDMLEGRDPGFEIVTVTVVTIADGTSVAVVEVVVAVIS